MPEKTIVSGTVRSSGSEIQLRRPRFLNELVVVPMDEGVVVDGAHELHILKGQAAQGLFVSLIRLMDGTRTLQDLETALPDAPSEHAREIISLLTGLSLVEDGPSPHLANADCNPETLAFFQRYRGATRVNRDGQEAYERLEQSQVVIVSRENDDSQAHQLKSLLEKCGARDVNAVQPEWLKTFQPLRERTTLRSLVISVSFAGEDADWALELDNWCARHEIPWLRAVVAPHANYADIGPLFNRKTGPCYRCFREVHSRQAASPSVAGLTEDMRDESYFWTGMVATEAIYFLSGIGPLVTGRDFHRYDLSSRKSQPFRLVRVPGCLACRPSHSGTTNSDAEHEASRLDLAVAFEDVVGLPSRALSGPIAQQENLAASLTLPRRPKNLSHCSHISLSRRAPKLDLATLEALRPADSVGSQQPLTVDELSTVLMMTAGVRDSRRGGIVGRWAATAGNLGSVELYLAVRRVEGLAPGVYFYRPFEHSLACLRGRSQDLSIEEFMSRVMGMDPTRLPDVLVLLTGAFHRVARKYQSFGYRLTNLDAGAATSQLHTVARSLNISSQTAGRWADDLIEEQLHLEAIEEQSTAVVALSRQERPYPLLPGLPLQLRQGSPASAKSARYFFERSVEAIFRELYRASRVKESELALGPFPISELAGSVDISKGPSSGVALPAPARGGHSIGEVLLSRKSVRHFTDSSLSTKQLNTMLYTAYWGDAHEWPVQHRFQQPLTFVVLACRIEGLAPGVYKYNFGPQDQALEFMSSLCSLSDRVELFVQAEFASAPVCVWIAGNLAAACAQQGAFGHRQLLLRAGAAGHRMWMAALAMGLSGCLVAGLVPGVARNQLPLDGYEQASLFGFVAGYGARYASSSDNLVESLYESHE